MREDVRPLRLAEGARDDEPVTRGDAASTGARRWLPAAAAAVAFSAAFGLGMATKSSSGPQTPTSLVPPVSIQAPRAAVPALDRAVQTPALKPRKPPAPRPQKPPPAAPTSTAPTQAPAPAPSTSVTPAPHTGVTQIPSGVTHVPSGVTHVPSGVVHSPSGVIHSPGGGSSGVVHSGP